MPRKTKPFVKVHNWELIEKTYMNGEPTKIGTVRFYSLREISDKFNVTYLQLRQRAAKYHWTDKRERQRLLIEQKMVEFNAERIADLGNKLDNKTLDIAVRAIETIRAYFILQEKAVKKAIEAGNDDFKMLKPQALSQIGNALLKFQTVGKVAIGEIMPPIPNENKFTKEFLDEESAMTPEQKKQFVGIALQFRKQSLIDDGNGNGNGSKHTK